MQPATQRQLCAGSRDAALIHGLALLAAGIATMVAATFNPAGHAFFPSLLVAVSASTVLCVWSLVLAIRAWRRNEPSGAPRVVVVLCVLECAIFCLLFLSNQIEPWKHGGILRSFANSGLIVVVPWFILSSWLALLMARWSVRRAVKRDTVAGVTGNRHWKRALAWFCAVMLVLIPIPLHLYCLYSASHLDSTRWQYQTIDYTPEAVSDAVAEMLSRIPGQSAKKMYNLLLHRGCVSKSRLTAEVSSADEEAQGNALQSLRHIDPQAALTIAVDVGDGKITGCGQWLKEVAAWTIIERGTREQVRHVLDAANSIAVSPRGFMAGGVWWDRIWAERQLWPELAHFCEGYSSARDEALRALACAAPPQELPRLWAKFLSDSDAKRRKQSLDAMGYIFDHSAKLRILLDGLDQTDPVHRHEFAAALLCAHPIIDIRAIDPALAKDSTAKLLPRLDSDDIYVRRAAAGLLAWSLNLPTAPIPEATAFFQIAQQVAAGVNPPETDDELRMTENVRAAAKKWLAQQK